MAKKTYPRRKTTVVRDLPSGDQIIESADIDVEGKYRRRPDIPDIDLEDLRPQVSTPQPQQRIVDDIAQNTSGQAEQIRIFQVQPILFDPFEGMFGQTRLVECADNDEERDKEDQQLPIDQFQNFLALQSVAAEQNTGSREGYQITGKRGEKQNDNNADRPQPLDRTPSVELGVIFWRLHI